MVRHAIGHISFLPALALAIAIGTTSQSHAASITPLGDLSGGVFESRAAGVSDDGTVVVGQATTASGSMAFRWTAGGGMSALGTLSGATSTAAGVSADGSVVVGGSASQAFRWTSGGGMVGLGYLPGFGGFSSASAVSADGSVVVGRAATNWQEAFRWTAGTGMVALGDLPTGNPDSSASAVSDDGQIVVGVGRIAAATPSGNTDEAFLWTSGGGMSGLGDLPGGQIESSAIAISGNGQVVVGRGKPGTGSIREAFRWTEGGGMVSLDDGVGGDFNSSFAQAVSYDGSRIAGDAEGAFYTQSGAFLWQADTGMLNIMQGLIDLGVDMSHWQSLQRITGMSSDGKYLVGWGGRAGSGGGTEAFLIHLPENLPAPALIPEPSSMAIAIVGILSLAGLGCVRRQKRSPGQKCPAQI